ncbi:hypothetical protein AB0K14_37550 [Actinosynnema sp. NPDC050801]|uniref:hypothetical protein n=1 Tax=unclassified Actinosynnema TaxID=2637065 RepID=UPI0033C34701
MVGQPLRAELHLRQRRLRDRRPGPYDWPVQFPDRSGRYAWQWSGNAADRQDRRLGRPAACVKSTNQYTATGLGAQSVRIAFTPTNGGLQWHPVAVDVTAGATTTVDLTAN